MKKAWEAILPPMDTPANIKMRNSIITALEIDEWAFRESVSVSRRKKKISFIYNLISISSFFLKCTIILYNKNLNRLPNAILTFLFSLTM